MQDINIQTEFFSNGIEGMGICGDITATVLVTGEVGENRLTKKQTRIKNQKYKSKMKTSNMIPMRKMNRTIRYFSPGRIDNDEVNSNGGGYSSSTIVVIVTFINQYT